MPTPVPVGGVKRTDPAADLEGARRGSLSALGRLLAREEPGLKKRAARECRGRFGVKVSPSDLVQATLKKATEDFPKCSSERFSGFAAWVQRIQATQVSKQRRGWWRRKRSIGREEPQVRSSSCRMREPIDGAAPSPSAGVRRGEFAESLGAALAMLGPEQRVAAGLVYRDGLTHEQAGQRLGISTKAVEHRIRDAKDRLRTLLGHYRDGY